MLDMMGIELCVTDIKKDPKDFYLSLGSDAIHKVVYVLTFSTSINK